MLINKIHEKSMKYNANVNSTLPMFLYIIEIVKKLIIKKLIKIN